MASDSSVDLWLFIDIIRNTRAYQSLRKKPKKGHWEFRKADFQEKKSASKSSRLITSWLDLLPNTQQREHHLDWTFVNQTYPRITACGREIFFRSKTFRVSPLCFTALRQLELAGRTSDDLVLAKAYIHHIAAPVGVGLDGYMLYLRNTHRFTRLQSLSVCAAVKETSPGGFMPAEPHDFASYGRIVAFERPTAQIEGLVRLLGLHVRKLTFHWITMSDAPKAEPPAPRVLQYEPPTLRDLQKELIGGLRGEVLQRAPAEDMAVERELYMQTYMRVIRS